MRHVPRRTQRVSSNYGDVGELRNALADAGISIPKAAHIYNNRDSEFRRLYISDATAINEAPDEVKQKLERALEERFDDRLHSTSLKYNAHRRGVISFTVRLKLE